MVVSNGTSTQPRFIISYDPADVSVSLLTAFNFTGYDVQQGDLYTLFELNTPSLIHIPAIDQYNNLILEAPEAYCGYYVMDETLSYGQTIVARQINEYDNESRYCHLSSPFPSSWSPTDTYTLRKSLPFEKWTLFAATTRDMNGYIVFTLPPHASNSETLYLHKYIYQTIYQPTNDDIYQFKAMYGIYQIVKYDPVAHQVSCLDMNDHNSPPTIGDTINIVDYEYDNTSPISYTGSIISQNQTVCYEISLISLFLPNVTLTTGSRAAFYPYVYVMFENATISSGASHDLIYSNNPSSGNALFIVHIQDVVHPNVGRFVKLAGRMRQVVKFKPNTTLRFAVYLPDGSPFIPIKRDRFSPYEPDPLLQINAVFSIRRL
jgi:hypothetical protein